MAKERTIACKHYKSEGTCDIKPNKKCRFWKEMQTCPTYKKLEGGKPVRTDNRRQKLDRIQRKDREY